MRKIEDYRLKGRRIFIGLDAAKRTWKLCVRRQRMIVHQTSMPGEYENLREYIRNNYPQCEVEVIYEAGRIVGERSIANRWWNRMRTINR